MITPVNIRDRIWSLIRKCVVLLSISLATGQVSWAMVEHILSVSTPTGENIFCIFKVLHQLNPQFNSIINVCTAGKEKYGRCSLKALEKHLIQGVLVIFSGVPFFFLFILVFLFLFLLHPSTLHHMIPTFIAGQEMVELWSVLLWGSSCAVKPCMSWVSQPAGLPGERGGQGLGFNNLY